MNAIPADIRDRILAAAAELYEQGGRSALPTVDQVRRAARADMNATSMVMREWRRAQTAQAAPATVLPEALQQASTAALASLWNQAPALANESLRSAQASWDAKRGELDAIRQELAGLCDAQSQELEQIKAAAATAEQTHRRTSKPPSRQPKRSPPCAPNWPGRLPGPTKPRRCARNGTRPSLMPPKRANARRNWLASSPRPTRRMPNCWCGWRHRRRSGSGAGMVFLRVMRVRQSAPSSWRVRAMQVHSPLHPACIPTRIRTAQVPPCFTHVAVRKTRRLEWKSTSTMPCARLAVSHVQRVACTQTTKAQSACRRGWATRKAR